MLLYIAVTLNDNRLMRATHLNFQKVGTGLQNGQTE